MKLVRVDRLLVPVLVREMGDLHKNWIKAKWMILLKSAKVNGSYPGVFFRKENKKPFLSFEQCTVSVFLNVRSWFMG
jgi:hypothetical protein